MKNIIIILLVLLALFGGSWYWMKSYKPAAVKTPDVTADSHKNPPAQGVNYVENGPLGIATGPNGQYLVDKNGRTLYLNIQDAKQTDTAIKSSCNAECEKTWEPFLGSAILKTTNPLLSKLNVFTRPDGKQQYAFGNQPLYRYSGDSKLGDTNGLSVSGWILAKP